MSLFQLVHRTSDSGFMGDQGGADSVPANQADNIGGDFLVGHLRDSRIQLLGGKALPVQRQAQGAQALTGQFLRLCTNDIQCGNFIQIGLDVIRKCVQIIFRLTAIAIAPGMFQEFILMVGDHHRAAAIRLELRQHFE